MYREDYFDQEDLVVNNTKLDKILEESKKIDKGHNVIYVEVQKKNVFVEKIINCFLNCQPNYSSNFYRENVFK
jgi:hypothetical protein